MSVAIRTVTGLSAALGTMAFVLTVAVTTPQPRPTAQASASCPMELKAKEAARVRLGA